MGINLDEPEASMLFQADSPAYPEIPLLPGRRHSGRVRKDHPDASKPVKPARVLLSLATGAGKTIIAANLLWRLHEAERLPKPALFLCDRDELREQAYTKLKAVFGDNARIVETKQGENAAQECPHPHRHLPDARARRRRGLRQLPHRTLSARMLSA